MRCGCSELGAFPRSWAFQIEDDTARAIRENAGLCRLLSRERVCAEAEKTLLSPLTSDAFRHAPRGAACRLRDRAEITSCRRSGPFPRNRMCAGRCCGFWFPALDMQQFHLPSRRVQLAETAAAAYRPSYARQELQGAACGFRGRRRARVRKAFKSGSASGGNSAKRRMRQLCAALP